MSPQIITYIGSAAVVVVLFIVMLFTVFKAFYRKVGPNEVLVISGRKGDIIEDERGGKHRLGFRVVRGGGTLVYPFLERVDTMSLELITLDIVTPEFNAEIMARLQAHHGTHSQPLDRLRRVQRRHDVRRRIAEDVAAKTLDVGR